MQVKVRDLHPNPFRRIERYPIRREKVEALRESLRQTGFWDNVVARQEDGRVEIAYGHHRLVALQEEYGPDREVNVILRDLDDAHMLQIMAAENMEEWGTSAWVEMETVQAVLQAYGEGRIELEEPDGRGASRWGAIYYAVLTETVPSKPYTSTTVAKFLGWYERSRLTGEATGPSYKVATAIGALGLIAQGVLTEEDFAGLGSTQAMAVVEQTRRAMRDQEAARLKREAEAQRKAAQAARDEATREEANRKRREAERAAAEQELKGREAAARVGRHVSEGLRSGETTYKQAAARAEEVLGPRDTVLRPMNDYAYRVAQALSKILDGDKLGQEVDELLRFRDQLSPQRRADLVIHLRGAAARLEVAAERFEDGSVEASLQATEANPPLAALTN